MKTGIDYIYSLFSDTLDMAKDDIMYGSEVSLTIANNRIWYLRGLCAAARLADYMYTQDRETVKKMRIMLEQIEQEYDEKAETP